MNEFNFDISKTAVFRAQKISSFPLCKHTPFLAKLFLVLFCLSLLLSPFAFFGLVVAPFAAALPASLLFFAVFFFLFLFF